MKVISSNINGLNSAVKYRFFDWLTWQSPDIACLQELNVADITTAFAKWARQAGYEIALSPRVGKDNGGVAILSRHGFDDIEVASGLLRDRGQIVCARIGPLSVCSAYVSLNNSEEERHTFQGIFDAMAERNDLALICGDFNIIATEREADTKYHSGSLGFKPEERAWLGSILRTWTDVLPLCCDGERIRTFWIRNKERFEANLGTRIDYQLASPELAKLALPKSGSVFREYFRGLRITDHGPIIIEYNLALGDESSPIRKSLA